MKGKKGAGKFTRAIHGIKVLSTLLIFGALCAGCATKQEDAALVETQNNVVEIDNRIAAIEGQVQSLGQEVHASQNRVYDVYYKSGKKTGMTARPIAQNAPQTGAPVAASPVVPGQVPVAYASPMSNTPMPSQVTPKPSPKPVPVAPASAPISATAPATVSGIPASAQHAIVPQPNQKPKAPLGSLDPKNKMELKDGAKVETVASKAAEQGAGVQELSLPPETAMYIPTASAQNAAAPAAQAPAQIPGQATAVAPAATTDPMVASVAQNQAPMPAATPVMATTPTPQPVKKARPLSKEKAAYKQALDMVRGGQTTAGRAQFEAFLQAYPQSSLVPNAYYWIGESYYSQGNFTNALYAFKQVTTHFPKHHKTSDALLKAGMTYQKLGDSANAQMQYRALLADFPTSNAAKIVRNRNL